MKFSDIRGDQSIGKIVEVLTNGWKRLVKASDPVHLDPDLKITSLLTGCSERRVQDRPVYLETINSLEMSK